MKVYLKGLNACAMRNQKLVQYQAYLEANGHILAETPEEAEAVILWTCAFRADHRDSSLEKIGEYLETQSAKILAAGCLPDIAGELLPSHERLVPVHWKNDAAVLDPLFASTRPLAEFSPVFIEDQRCPDAARYRRENPGEDAVFHDQFIKLLIQEGCGFNCSYCSEKLAFPPYRSFPLEELYEACKEAVERTGVYDVMLLGDSIGQYGADLGSGLGDLLSRLKSIHPNLAFAFNNLHLYDFLQWKDVLRKLIAEGRVKHLNLPIQAASDRILKSMNRLYTKADIEAAFSLLQVIGFSDFDTHIIIGFPGETDEDVDEILELLLRYKPRYVLASKYMESREAPAARLPDKVPDETTEARLLHLSSVLSQAGIICNHDGSELSRERIKRLKDEAH